MIAWGLYVFHLTILGWLLVLLILWDAALTANSQCYATKELGGRLASHYKSEIVMDLGNLGTELLHLSYELVQQLPACHQIVTREGTKSVCVVHNLALCKE